MNDNKDPKPTDELLTSNPFARIAMKTTPDLIQGTWVMVYALITALLAIALEIKRLRQYLTDKAESDFNKELWKVE